MTPPSKGLAWAATAAVLIVASGGGWIVWKEMNPETPQLAFKPKPQISFDQIYSDTLARGWKPDWKCRNEEEFASTFFGRFGQGLFLADPLPAGIETIGLSYEYSISPESVHLVARAHGEGVIVFIDMKNKDSNPTADPSSGLKVFRKEMDFYVFYEVSPHSQPYLLDLFEERDIPMQWKRKGYRQLAPFDEAPETQDDEAPEPSADSG